MKKFFTLLACTLLFACESAPAGYTPEPFDFSSKTPIRFDVAEIRVIDTYHPPMTPPNVDHEFPVPPNAAINLWVKQRLAAVGHQGTLEVTIDDASVKETTLPKTKGVKGLFTNEQDRRYDLHAHVLFRLYNGTDAMSIAAGDVTITRSHTLAENATVDDRTKLFDKMAKDMMASFDAQAVQRFNQYFSVYLR